MHTFFEFFKRRWKKSIDPDFGHKEEDEEEEEEEGKGERTSSYTFATSSSPSISSSRFLPSSFRRLSCSNLCFAWSVFDAWRRDGRALMMFCARSYLLFLFDRQRRTHTHKKISQRTTTPTTTQPRRLHQHNNRDEDERSSKDDLLETTTDRTRFAIQNHAGADRTTTNVCAMTTTKAILIL